MVSLLISYLSYSGNTKEVAELIEHNCQKLGVIADLYRIGTSEPIPDVASYDAVMVGCFTWGKGETPKKMKKFILDVGFKPACVYVFGTGDTQFGGDELFCSAADKLHRFFHSPLPVLKVEQSPRGSQEILVEEWTQRVVEHYERMINE